ncbi:4'-phosphopantetheinyl transferase family protein [Dyadobacter psychrotolerans]|uniref:4'-phosphopantetheinyl transferase superfamily protein n=1 Tax=Dyadobacter psychrotolerans TaxID=2541721 RepID=A0A4R5DE81_9BACT|nr:4'-phosphopantetheinyl transferase superfamily protein [Dyadobacter psychrotolerans]TDE11387.1 4'-phosphopantetheinyl transferase superfamily protein [Dyadobacter psychrotolerans]
MSTAYIKTPTENSILGLWHINESVQELLASLRLSENERHTFESKKNDARKKEWLACRNLLKAMTAGDLEIKYDSNGRPYFDDKVFEISISHSAEYACVYLNNKKPVGVDIQKIKPAISTGSDFFLSQEENKWVDKEDNLMLHIIWSGKESAFKYCGIMDLDLKKDIHISNFTRNQIGIIEVTILNYDLKDKILINYECFDDYVLTRTV